MSSSNIQPPKLTYAKGRNKSRQKIESSQDDKKSNEPSSQTDIFAHLNQDNLNYIKKQLKNKKNINMRNSNTQEKPTTINSNSNLNNTFNSNNFIQEKQKSEDIIVIESVPSNQSIEKHITQSNNNNINMNRNNNMMNSTNMNKNNSMINSTNNSNLNNSNPQVIQSSQVTFASITHQPNSPKPILNNNKDFLNPPPSTLSLLNQLKHKQQKQQFFQQSQRKRFLQYQLKSQQNSQSNVQQIRTENLLSQNGSMALKGSQFIDYLQTYIAQLNTTPQKVKNNLKNFNKNKSIKIQKQSSKIYQNNKKSKQFQKYPPIHQLQNQYNHRIQSNQSKQQNQQSQNIKYYKRQLQKQRFYSMTLAVQLQKYKQNQQKYKRQVEILSDTLKLLIKQTNYMKFTLNQEIKKNTQIQSKINNINRLNKSRSNTFDNQNNVVTVNNRRKSTQNQNQLNQFINFTKRNSLYNDLNPQFYQKLINRFQQGQKDYEKDKQNPKGKQNKDKDRIIMNKINKLFNSNNSKQYQHYIDQHIPQKQKKKQYNYLSNNTYKDSQRSNFKFNDSDSKKSQKKSLQKLKEEYKKFKQQIQNSKFKQKKQYKEPYSYRSKRPSNIYE